MGIITAINDLSMRTLGEKVRGRVDENVKLKIVEKVARKISEYSKVEYSEIFAKLIKGDMRKIEHTGFGGSRGVYSPPGNILYFDDDAINGMLGEEITDSTAIHENIHKLQKRERFVFSRKRNKRNSRRGN